MSKLENYQAKESIYKRPLVSICTITYNRYKFLTILKSHILNQTYSKNLIEWVIVDDSTDRVIENVLDDDNLMIRYKKLNQKTSIGEKRNIAINYSKGEVILFMDDDDYYPVNRVSHAVDNLLSSKKLICGSTYIPIFYLNDNELWMAGPYGKNHATAATFAFKRELTKHTQFNNKNQLSEEKEFLKDYTIPLLQLDPFNTIICIAHKSNSFDKQQMRINPTKYNLNKMEKNNSNIHLINKLREIYGDFK